MNKFFLLSIDLRESRKISMQKEILFLSNKKDDKIFLPHILNDYCNNYKYIDFLPLLNVVEIYKTSKIKDIIQTLESGNNLLISDKLKNALTILPLNDVQFFKVSVFQGAVEHPNYWYMHATKNNDDFIDFEKSEVFWYESIVGHEGKVMSDINSFKDFSILEEKWFFGLFSGIIKFKIIS